MLLYPKKTKFKTLFSRKRIKFLNNRIFSASLKNFAIVSVEAGKLNNKQIESLRKTLKRLLKSQGKY
jgi:ribosomal protein L16/L10AE